MRPLQSAEIIAVGSEMLGSIRLDTNSLFLSERLGRLGIDLRAKSVVGDRRADLAASIRLALERVDLVILTGGLGPTDDDLTRDVVAGVLGLPMSEDASIVAGIEARFAQRGLRMPEINRRQAMVPAGGEVLANPNGSAPGLLLAAGERIVLLLPGPPREMQPMFDAVSAARLESRASRARFERVAMFVVGRSESHVDEAIQPICRPLLEGNPPVETTVLAAPGQIEVHLSTRSGDAEAARGILSGARDRIVAALGPDVFTVDGQAMEEVVGAALKAGGWTIAAMESCTGGLMLSRLTDVPGSSAYVLGGVVAYSNDLKTAFAGVEPALFEQHGAVSEPVAQAMARGIRERTGATFGVGITGIAGPGGGTAEKPVGTVALAVAGPAGIDTRVSRFPGGRSQVKFLASQIALDMVRRMLLRQAHADRG